MTRLLAFARTEPLEAVCRAIILLAIFPALWIWVTK